MLYPKFIDRGSCIGIPAPSNGASNLLKVHKFKNAEKTMESLGYKLVLSENIFLSNRGRSAEAQIRADELNKMFSDSNIDFILCAAGGDFLIEILPYVNFELLRQNPKFVAGFSDPTGILYVITTKYDIATIYGQNFGAFGMEKLHKSQEDFLKIVSGEVVQQESYQLYEDIRAQEITGLEGYNLTKPVYWDTLDGKEVDVKGRIIGGCLDIISELAGTKYDGIESFNERYKEDGIIWYFDNAELSCEETIRLLWKLDTLEYFKYTKCVIFGRFGVYNTYYDYDTKTCLQDSVLNKRGIKIVYNADISHKKPCINIINGSIANINVKDGKGKISFYLKE